MSHRQIMEAFTGLLLALLVAMLSSTIVSNALPTILADLNGSQSQYTWVVTATLLTSTATTPLWGKLSDLFSKKLLYQLSIVIFTVGSVLGGISQSMPELIAFRALQGIGLGGMQALIQVVIAAMIAPRDRGRYSGYIGAVFAVATVSGPLIGGLIVDSPLGWRWCFWAVVPVAVLAFIVLGRTLKLPVLKREVQIDWLGATLLVGGVALLLIWVSLAGTSFAWGSWTTVAYVGGAVLALGLAVLVESKVAEPVIPLRLFRNRTFTLSVLGSLAVGTAMFGGSVFLGQYYQISRGFSPTHAGLMTLPMVLGLALSSTVAGQVISRTGKTKMFMVPGAILLMAGLFLLSTVDHTTNLTLMGAYLAAMGLGLGLLMQNLVLVVQNTVSMRDMGSASSVVTFFRSLGGAAGVSALGAVLAAQVSTNIVGSLTKLGLPTAGATNGGGGTLNLAALPGPMREIVRAAFGDATGKVFLIAGIVAVVTFVAVLLIKEVPLRSTLDTEVTKVAGPLPAQVVLADESISSHVHGRVTGATGRPLAGAVLTLTDAAGRQVDLGRTDGEYELSAPRGGDHVVIASAGQLRPVASRVRLNGVPVRADLALAGMGGVDGQIKSAGGHAAVAGATLVLTDPAGSVLEAGLTGGDGWYRFDEIPAGAYTLTVTSPGYRPIAGPLTVPEGARARHDVELEATAGVGGVVRSGKLGHPVPEAQVTLVDTSGQVVATTLTDRDGAYRFTDLPDGDYTLITTGYAPAVSPLAIAGGTEVGQDVELGYPAR
ncbi:MFS transporter [Amycolatopsis sp. H20-H5]|uniref:MFS transporter n=1 Tax=Amycolatopsis sp. H20-H5 TaxID=3046309 RepID=UPI002DBEDB3D|nr:MFS transporter [Amycolatopsis sp. H20-H5]MEC3975627.1 MFS transporter [Amycolatopsis sp. H20-H5]